MGHVFNPNRSNDRFGLNNVSVSLKYIPVYQAAGDGDAHGVCIVLGIETAEDELAVIFHGVLADKYSLGYFTAGQSHGYQRQHLCSSVGKAVADICQSEEALAEIRHPCRHRLYSRL